MASIEIIKRAYDLALIDEPMLTWDAFRMRVLRDQKAAIECVRKVEKAQLDALEGRLVKRLNEVKKQKREIGS